MKLNTINSSKLTWFIMDGDEGCNVRSYCADGDGILQVVEYANGVFCLEDQMERVKTWRDVDGLEEFLLILEEAQNYLAATYHEIYEDCLLDYQPTTDELRQEMNAVNGFAHLDK